MAEVPAIDISSNEFKLKNLSKDNLLSERSNNNEDSIND